MPAYIAAQSHFLCVLTRRCTKSNRVVIGRDLFWSLVLAARLALLCGPNETESFTNGRNGFMPTSFLLDVASNRLVQHVLPAAAATWLQPFGICESHAQSAEHRELRCCGPSTRQHLHSLAVGNGARGINKMLFMNVICKQRLPFVTGNCRRGRGGQEGRGQTEGFAGEAGQDKPNMKMSLSASKISFGTRCGSQLVS